MKANMNYQLLLLLAISSLVTAQTKPTNHWHVGGSVGYAFSIQDEDNAAYRDLELQGDSVIGLIPGDYRYGTSSGIQIDLEAVFQKKSGWYNILGLQSFLSIPNTYFRSYDGRYNPDPYWNTRIRKSGGYAMFKFGLGYRVTYKRNANLFMGANLLYGGGWYNLKASNGYEENWEWRIRSTYFDSFLLGLGINAEVGTLLKLNKNIDGIIKAGINAAMFSVWNFGKETGYNSSRATTGDVAHEFFNINFSLGIRYKL
jgi:hypothetical protein